MLKTLSNASAGLNFLDFTLLLTCLRICTLTIICARANCRLHYLKRLKRAGLPIDRLAI